MLVVRHGVVIKADMLPSNDGNNINGPSVIRVPEWIKNPLGKYYMYFAHHSGTYIRLAFSDHPTGPWTVYQRGSLALKDCPAVRNHVASPDVHVDEVGRQIVMYFHGPSKADKGQKTFVAASVDGINFLPSPEALGIFYFRVWPHLGWWYALGKSRLYRSKDMFGGFQSGPIVLEAPDTTSEDMKEPGNIRHTAVLPEADHLTVFYTKQADAPERIMIGTIDMSRPWTKWRIVNEQQLLTPEYPWEGATLPIEPSSPGSATTPVNQLRDPCILRDCERTWLYYCAAGETAIAVAEFIN